MLGYLFVPAEVVNRVVGRADYADIEFSDKGLPPVFRGLELGGALFVDIAG